MTTELNDLTTFDNYDMNGWVAELAPTTIEKTGTQFYLQKPQSVPDDLGLWKPLPLQSHTEYALKIKGESGSRIRLWIGLRPNEKLHEVEIKLDGFSAELTIPFVTNELPGPDPVFAMLWDVLADFNEDNSFKIAQLHILSIPAKR